jgi:Flp pilus assembly protein TadG
MLKDKPLKNQRLRRLLRDTRGNTYMLVAAALMPLIGIVGSGVDIGRAYMTDLRLQQACDAGVLAGRRAMTGGTYTAAHKAEATKMFNFNFSSDAAYGSTNIAFNSVQDGPSNVVGTATAKLPTTLMRAFGQNEFDLSVNCTAKLEISNVDVMLVLDVTGSMASTNSGDTVNRITALKNATMNFFDTLMAASTGDGRIRFGVVPYDTNINVGQILLAKNPNWLSDDVTLPSRTPLYTTTWGTGTTTYGSPYDGPVTWDGWGNNGGTISGKDSTSCPATPPPADSAPTTDGSPWQTQTSQYIDSNGNQVTTYDNNQKYRFWNYQYVWTSSSTCQRQRRRGYFTRTIPSTVTQPPVPVFARYRYEDRVFDVSAFKTGGTVTANVGDNGTNSSASFSGCIIERQTAPFAANQSAPSSAFDMDIDMVPTANEGTKWQMQARNFAFWRNQEATEDTTNDRGSWGDWDCPQAAMKLTTMTAADRSTFNSYIQALDPGGNTYHDFGMVWGSRLLSPTGIFADENSTAPNGRPIQRHLIFMTDGDMYTQMGNLGLQGHEFTMQRVGSTSNNDGTARHNNRFLQLCAQMKSKNVTVWTIDFDSSQTATLVTCASGSDKAMLAANAAALNNQFQAIARQISRLRLHQ